MHVTSGVLAAGDLRDLDLRVAVQQAQQLAAGVAAAADDGRAHHAVTRACVSA